MAHLKRLLSPSFWKVPKKEKKWVVTPHAGPHPKMQSIPLSVILTHMLKIADTTTEAKKIIRKGEIFVDGKRRKDYAYPVGLFDVVSVPKLKKHYRVVPGGKGLELIGIEKDANLKICAIDDKSVLRKSKTQLNLHDGKTILVENGNYKTGDSLLVELPSLKIVEHLPLEKGNIGLISHGTGSGKLGKVKELVKGTIREPQKVVCEVDKEDRTVSKHSFIVVGKERSAIKIS
ncbi:MAG: 30S ribosomal protein S4e [Candidatus Aenigmarchaeota archaeon]|nr:30S ribosomal protein S4e [Candidatus Aenigmarchaeota archaeon]